MLERIILSAIAGLATALITKSIIDLIVLGRMLKALRRRTRHERKHM